MQKKIGIAALSFAILLFLNACGSGSGSASPNAISFSTTQVGAAYSFNLVGSDNAGGSYTGTRQHIVDGPTVFEGQNVVQKRVLVTLSGTTIATRSSTDTYYFNPNGTVYKIVFDSGVTAVLASIHGYPPFVRIGDSGAGNSFQESNGSSFSLPWQVVDGGNGNAKLVISTFVNGNQTSEDSYVLDPSGNLLSITLVSFSNGVTRTLSTT